MSEGLSGPEKASYAQIDALLSIFPEMAYRRVAIGSSCLDVRDGKQLTVLGHVSNNQKLDTLLHERALFLSPFGKGFPKVTHVQALSFSQMSPER